MFSDNTAIGFVYPYVAEGGSQKWHVEQHSFIPWQQAGSLEAKMKQDGVNYRDLETKGYCTITSHPQGLINPEEVYRWLCEYVEDNQRDVVFFGYDAMGVSKLIKALESNTSFPMMPIRQRTSELKDPTKFLQTLFIEGNITRLDDEIMRKALINAVIKEDNIGIQVDKILNDMTGDVSFYGEPMTKEDKEKLRASLEVAVRVSMIEAKKKFTPKKYRGGGNHDNRKDNQ